MPPLETDCLNEYAVLWAAAGTFDNQGQHELAAAVQISVDWHTRDGSTLDQNGNEIKTEADVVVDRDIPIGSILWEGKLAGVANPPVDLYKVVARNRSKDVKGVETRRVVKLVRYSDKLPPLA